MTSDRTQVGWWYTRDDLPNEERFIDMRTAEEEGPFVEPYAAYMVPVWIERQEGDRQ